MEKILGIDWGEKRIGLALAEIGSRVALPWGVANDQDEVSALIENENIVQIVIGEPIKMDGRAGTDKRYREFCRRLERDFSGRIIYVDERLSSLAADRLPGGKKEKAERDAVAAMLILQAFLDQQS